MRLLWAFRTTRVCYHYHCACKSRNDLGHQVRVPAPIPIHVRRCRFEESTVPQPTIEVWTLSPCSPSSTWQDNKKDTYCPSQCCLALQYAWAHFTGARGICGTGTERCWFSAACECLEGDETHGLGADRFTHPKDVLAAFLYSPGRDWEGEHTSVDFPRFKTLCRTPGRSISSFKEGSNNYSSGSFCTRCLSYYLTADLCQSSTYFIHCIAATCTFCSAIVQSIRFFKRLPNMDKLRDRLRCHGRRRGYPSSDRSVCWTLVLHASWLLLSLFAFWIQSFPSLSLLVLHNKITLLTTFAAYVY